jgi:hypothetical protein
MIKFTKQQLTDLFEGGKSYEDLATEFSTSGTEVTPKMVQEMFKANGFNLRNRKRKTAESWFTIIDDTAPVVSDAPTYDSFNVHTEQFA